MAGPFNARGTLFFDAIAQNIGWSETYFLNVATHVAGLAVLNGLVPLRAGILQTTGRITWIRICNVDAPRDSRMQAIPPGVGTGTFDNVAHPSAGTSDSLLIRKDYDPDNNCFNKLFLHYIPEAIFLGRDYAGATTLPAWDVLYQAFRTYLLDPANSFLVRKGPAPYVYKALNVMEIKWRTEHKIGRPFGLSVGRRGTA
jgi:hypothetical protein